MNRDEIPSTSVSGRPKRMLGAEVMERWHSEGHREGPIFLQLAWFLTNLIIEGELNSLQAKELLVLANQSILGFGQDLLEVGTGEVRVGRRCAGQVRSEQVGALEIRPAEVCSGEVRSGEAAVEPVRSGPIDAGEIRT